MYLRILSLEDEKNNRLLLWGARQEGKTTLLEQLFPRTFSKCTVEFRNNLKLAVNFFKVADVTHFCESVQKRLGLAGGCRRWLNIKISN